MRTSSVIRRLLRDSFTSRAHLAAGLLGVIAVGLAQLLLTWLVKRWLEGPLVTGDAAVLGRQMSQTALLLAAGAAVLCWSRYYIARANQSLLKRLRARAMARVLSLDVPASYSRPTGDLVSRLLHDVNALSGFIEFVVWRAGYETTICAGALTMLFVLKWRFALATVTVLPLTVALFAGIGRLIRRWRTSAHAGVGALASLLNEQLHGLSTIKGFQTEAFELRRFNESNEIVRRRIVRAEVWAGWLISSVFLVTGAGLLAVGWYGSRELAAGTITQAELLTFCLYAAQTVEPFRRLSEVHGILQSSAAAAERVYELIDLPKEWVEEGTATHAPIAGAIRFDQVDFKYPNGRVVHAGLTLAIAAGEQVALVGTTGSGKSTLARLLVRFFDPARGRILLDGEDVVRLPLGDLRRAVCVVEQEPFLFSGPLLENLRYGSWSASRQEVEAAAALAGLTPTLARMRHGLDTVLSESGRELSGGEKQRVALARAIARNPRVLVLDEATSALDSDTEAEIFAALGPWLRARTVIAIGHRLSMVARFPRVVVLQDGRLIGDGSVDALTDTCRPFVSLFTGQWSVTTRDPASGGQ